MRDHGISLYVNGEKLTANAAVKLLGFGIGPKLHEEYQTEITQSKVAPRNDAIKLLASTRWDCDPSTLLPLYRPYARPVLEYARPILLTRNIGIKNKMEVYQNS